MDFQKNETRSRPPERLAGFLAALLTIPLGLPARPAAGATVTLSQALVLAERQGYDFLLADAAVRGAEADLVAARRPANPLFAGAVLRSTGVPVGGGSVSARGYSVAFADQGVLEGLASGKRSLRVREAEAALSSARRNREDALRLLRFEVAQAFYAVLAAEARQGTEAEVAASFRRALELVQTRYRYGAVSEVDVDRVETAQLEAEQAAVAARAQVAQAKATLAFLLGGVSPELEVSGSLEGAAPAWADAEPAVLVVEALARRPDVGAARAALDRAEAALALARRERLPDVTLSAGFAREGPDAAPITPPTLTVGAVFELPVFSQRQGEIARAASDRASAKIALDRVCASVTTDVLAAQTAYRAARDQVERMTARLLGSARRARDLVRIQYRAGAISLLDMLDAERTALAVELEYRQDLYALRTAVAQLAAAAGREPVS